MRVENRAARTSRLIADADLVLGAYKLKFTDLLLKQEDINFLTIKNIADTTVKALKLESVSALSRINSNVLAELSADVGVTSDGASHKDSYHIVPEHTPAGAGDTGTKGQICFDAGYTYVCYATDTWARVAHSW